MWHLMMVAIIALVGLDIILIVCLVHYAREGAHNAGKLEVHEEMMNEAKTVPIQGRDAR